MLNGRAVLLGALLLAGCAAPPPPAQAPAGIARGTDPRPALPAPPTETGLVAVPRLPPTPVLPPAPEWINRPPAPEPVPGSLAALAPAARPAPAPNLPQPAAPAPAPAAPPAVQPAAAAAPRPGVGTEDRRVAVDNAVAPWRSIGMVAAEGGARCTGALIGPRQVLTAAHCVVRRGTSDPQLPSGVRYVIGPTPQGAGREVAVASIFIPPGFHVLPGPRPDPSAPPDADWAVLTLDPAAPEAPPDFILPVVQGLMPPMTPLAFGGYQPDRGRGLVADLDCWILGYARDAAGRVMLRHSCAGTGGSSGGPLLARQPDGTWMVAGIGSLALSTRVGGWGVPSITIWRVMEEAPRPRPGA